ncbi:MAG: hypothetical protein E7287_02210 [Lachnospiraceae bacterium]|nr:hypothetical protein [Lachnospiraceae bacterium]
MKRGRSLELKQHIVCVLRRVLFIGVSVQIILGVLWCITNFAGLQEFGEVPQHLVKVRWLIYLLQLAVAGGAGYFAMGVFSIAKEGKYSRFFRIWGTLGLMTIPGVMQCHLAVLPNSIVCSMYLIMLSLGVRIIREETAYPARELAKMGVLWLAAGYLMPEYCLLGGVLVLTVGVWKAVRTKGGRYLFWVLLAFSGLSLCVSALRVQGYSVELRAVSRVVWPNFLENHGDWPVEVTDVMSPEMAVEISQTADAVFGVFAPLMEEALGEERANEVYWELAKTVAGIRSRELVQKILWDGACHTFSPYLLTKQLEGAGYQSYTGRNYEIMKANTPGITRHYVAYEGWWFVVGIVTAAIIGVLTIKGKKKSHWIEKILLIMSALVMVIYYTMQGAGIMDYKQTIYVTVLWALWMCRHVMPEDNEM